MRIKYRVKLPTRKKFSGRGWGNGVRRKSEFIKIKIAYYGDILVV